MVIIERRLAWCVYKMVFFADKNSLHQLTENLRPTELARFFYTTDKLDGLRVITRERTFTVHNDLRQSVETLWKGLARYSRMEISKAEKLGQRVRIGRNEPAVQRDFLSVFNDFARVKDGVRPISDRLLQRFELFADRLVLYLDEQPMVVNLVLRDAENGRVRGLYSASRRLDADEPKKARLIGNLNRMLHWHNMRLYKQEGFDTYDWGGISENRRDGRAKFKMSFGGTAVEENTYLCAGWPRLGTMVKPLFDLGHVRGRLKSALKASIERRSAGRVFFPNRTAEDKEQIARQIDITPDTTDQPKAS